MPTYLELCAGIGGLSLGLERAGWTPAGFVEIDPFCQRVLAHHWPDIPLWGDLTVLDPAELPGVDMVCGGIPCQPVSQAGRRRGLADPRWLWPHAARVVRHLRPRWVLVENVASLLAFDGGRAAQAVIGDLSRLGYDSEWFVLPASAVGAPHLRKRAFILADAVGPGLEESVVEQDGRQRPAAERVRDQRQGGPAESGVGHAADGLSRWLAGHPWPARPGDEQHPWEAPRTALGVSERPDKLRALGNAVVPAVAELVGRWILDGGRERRRLG